MPFELFSTTPDTAPVDGASAASGAPLRDWTPVVALAGLAGLALVLVIGVLIGRSGQSSAPKVAAAPQVITVQSSGGAVATTPTGRSARTSVASISQDWPSGKSAWSVELQKLSRSAATVASVNAAKSAATGKGATAVGVLNAASYTSLGRGYVIYSGVYPTPAKASAALAKLKKSFPTAKVIHVVPSGISSRGNVASGAPTSAAQQAAGAAAIKGLSSCTGSACSKAARKITKPIATPGKPPPKDKKAAGGGTPGQTFQ